MFLKKTSGATFLINWRKIYQQLIDLGKKRLESKSDKDLVEKKELAMESFGNNFVFCTMLDKVCN